MRLPTVAPAAEPVTLIEARLQCRTASDDSTEDARIQAYIVATRGMAEHETGQRLITQTWECVLDAWPASGCIILPQTPVQSVASVVYVNSAGTPITLAAEAYRLDKRGQRAVLRPAYGASWPSDVRSDVAVITITYVVGFGDVGDAVPAPIREWMLVHVAAMHEQRTAVSEVGSSMAPLPYMSSLLDPWRVYG